MYSDDQNKLHLIPQFDVNNNETNEFLCHKFYHVFNVVMWLSPSYQADPRLWRHRHEFCWWPHTRVFGEGWFSLRTHTGEFASPCNWSALCIYRVFRLLECIIVQRAEEELLISSKPFYRGRKSTPSLRSVATLVQSPCWWRDPTNTPSHRSKMPSGTG